MNRAPNPALPAPRPAFPFTALVGQTELQQALLLAAVDPAIGGVLIRGPRGTAKSTAARALAALLPGAPFVTLPLAASLEQLVGTLDVEAVLADGRLRPRPGLLARADGGVLYVDEVNLLPDALVDALLDAAASGVHTVERDSISLQQAARFVLVGTMNPEEGELRPQLLDRFGMAVTLANPADVATRMAIARARLAFDVDPVAAWHAQAAPLRALAEAVVAAQAHLPAVGLDEVVHERAATLALVAGVDGLRADLVMLRAARARAALDGRQHTTTADVDAVAALALSHRAGAVNQPAASPNAAEQAPQPLASAASPQPPPQPRPQPPQPGPADRATDADGTWGAMPAQAVGLTPITADAARGAWPPKA